MTNNQALEREYLAMAAANPGATRREFDAIVAYMKNSTAIHHKEYVRTCYAPKIFTRAQFEGFAADIRVLYGIFGKVVAEYFRSPAYRALFGFDARTETLILRADPSLSLLPMARIDFFYNEKTGAYKFCEFNTDGTSAMNEDRELNNAQQLSTVYRSFCDSHKVKTCELFDSWVDTFCAIYRRARGEATPSVAIVDFMECGTVNEFEIFRQHFAAKGIPTQICDIRDLRYENGVLTGPEGGKIDAIYRRAVTSDILDHYDQCGTLLDAVRDGNVLLLGDFHTQLIHNKTIFRILHRPETRALLTPAEREYLDQHLPYTAEYTPADAPRVLADKDHWILKPLDSYGSRGVYAGVEYDEEGWKAVVAALPAEGYLLQEFYCPYVSRNYGLKEEQFGLNEYYNLTGIYTYDGVARGVYSRVSLSPIISSQYSEKTIPTILVEDDAE